MKTTVIGAGVMGLTIAFRLAQRGLQVLVVDQTKLASKSSWAGAGILPPSNDLDPAHAIDHLQTLSNRLHPELSCELRELTGIDNEYQQCGGVYLARTAGEVASLMGVTGLWKKQGIQFRQLDKDDLFQLEPELAHNRANIKTAFLVPAESQLRNPRHLQALIAACTKLGVKFQTETRIKEIVPSLNSVSIRADSGRISADLVCVASGAWTSQLVHNISRVQVVPVKGHLLLYKLSQPLFRGVINECNRYVVSRLDGHVLVGSSEQECGFDESVSEDEVQRLKRFAHSLSPSLNDSTFVKSWTGLRPMAFDQLPYIGQHSDYPNVYLATGHFRSGLHLSPGTAEIICRQVMGEEVGFDFSALRPER